MKKILKYNYLKAQNFFEFLFVVIVLMLLFLLITDIALYFRQAYLVQSIADEALQNLTVNKRCSNDLALTSGTLSDIVKSFYSLGSDLEFTFEMVDSDKNYIFKNTSYGYYSSGDFTFSLICHSPSRPLSVTFSHNYKGLLFLSKKRFIDSNPAVNNVYY